MKKINSINEFKEEIKSGLVLADFYTNACRPCKQLEPVLESLTNIKVIKVDATSEVGAAYSISAVPTLIYFKDGIEVGKTVGFKSKEEIERKIASL